jgi:hypothetical protein
MGFEQFVRPFQTRDVTPPQLAITAGFSESNGPVRLRLGLSGATKTFHVSLSADTTVYVIKRPKERQTE